MAERRMFSKRITQSAKFLKMPVSAQCLYFHLGLNADDDGIVEAYSVLRLSNSAEDDLRILQAKGYIKVLNDDLVTYISDWRENNQIRADRKIDSIYKDLLLQIVPEAKLLPAKQRADRKQGVRGTSSGQHSIGKDSIDKDSIGKNKTGDDVAGDTGEEVINPDDDMKKKLIKVWQDNMGPIVPFITEGLLNLYDEFGYPVIEEAIKVAVLNNVRKLSYVEGVVMRLAANGGNNGSDKDTCHKNVVRECTENEKRACGVEI